VVDKEAGKWVSLLQIAKLRTINAVQDRMYDQWMMQKVV